MNISQHTIPAFVDVLASSAPVPGGGGASALVGAIGVALGNMVASLTIGKKKYAAVEGDILRLQIEATKLQNRLIALIDKDAEDFEPLSKAYAIPKDDPSRGAIMETALLAASETPLAIMRVCGEAIDIIAEFAEKGSTLAVSDAACGAVLCAAALRAAAFNVFINTKSMNDRSQAALLNAEADNLITKYTVISDNIAKSLENKLKGV